MAVEIEGKSAMEASAHGLVLLRDEDSAQRWKGMLVLEEVVAEGASHEFLCVFSTPRSRCGEGRGMAEEVESTCCCLSQNASHLKPAPQMLDCAEVREESVRHLGVEHSRCRVGRKVVAHTAH